MAIATPGSTDDRSLRMAANAPTKPVAIATMRSVTRGEVRPRTWLLCAKSTTSGITQASATAKPTTPTTDTTRSMTDWRSRAGDATTSAKASPIIGVAKGATIMAPITVAVESVTTPPVAITVDRARSTA